MTKTEISEISLKIPPWIFSPIYFCISSTQSLVKTICLGTPRYSLVKQCWEALLSLARPQWYMYVVRDKSHTQKINFIVLLNCSRWTLHFRLKNFRKILKNEREIIVLISACISTGLGERMCQMTKSFRLPLVGYYNEFKVVQRHNF